MKLKHAKKNSGFTLVELLVVIAIIAALAAISSPIIIRQIARSRATQAINNSKDIYVAVRDYAFARGGKSPDNNGAATSTLILNKLFTTGACRDEKPFFVAGINGLAAGNEDADLTSLAGTDTENAFNYFVHTAASGGNGETAGQGVNITNGASNNPVLTTPQGSVTAGTLVAFRWDTAPFGGQAVVLYSDGAAQAYDIKQANPASSGTGQLVDPDTDLPLAAASNTASLASLMVAVARD